MTEWIALSSLNHAEYYYQKRDDNHHASGQMTVPVTEDEIFKLVPHYVLAFTEGDYGLYPVALLGTEQNQNLYLDPNNSWLTSYVPFRLQTYPFALSVNDEGDEEIIISKNFLSERDGYRLFQSNGELSEALINIKTALTSHQKNVRFARYASQMLDGAGVLSSWKLSVGVGHSPKNIDGLYRVDEQALNALDDYKYAQLKLGGPMTFAYAQMFSEANVEKLTELARLRSGWFGVDSLNMSGPRRLH